MHSRIHYSINSFVDLTWKYEQRDNFKPEGLWYAFNNDWSNYCHSFCEERSLQNIHKFKLDIEMEKMIVLDNPGKVISLYRDNKNPADNPLTDMDWQKVKEKYAGIEIINYDDLYPGPGFFDGSDDYFYCSWWLSRWSINSGCIWDLSIIKSVEWIDAVTT